MAVSVRRLVHRGAARDLVRDRIALEDALGTALPDDGRLVLVRRLAVRGRLASPRGRQEAVLRGWVDAVAGAVHATSGFAGRANCVWFASRAEAEEILLRKLLAGEPVDGWFWALAVPDWQRLPLGEWLARRVTECLEARDQPALARIAQVCIEAGRAAAFVETVDRALRTGLAGPMAGEAPGSALAAAERVAPEIAGSPEALALAVAARLAPRVLPPAWRDLIARIERADLSAPARADLALAIVRERVRRAAPALALAPGLLSAVARALADSATGRPALPPAVEPAEEDSFKLLFDNYILIEQAGAATDERASPAGRERPPRRSVPRAAVPAPAPSLPEPAEAAPEPPAELASRHAGLWLVVPALIRLGLREWLAARPALLGDDPGRRLLLAIAIHHRVPRGDPALAMLDTRDDDEDARPWIEPWRVGLDRWLRRTARRRTHDLVARPGWVAPGDERLDVRFPSDAADLRLRRLALDADPGWTDWLGLSLRFHFGGGIRP